MKFKPFLLRNDREGSYNLVHVDTEKVRSMKPVYDSLQEVSNTKYSPLKNIHIPKKHHD